MVLTPASLRKRWWNENCEVPYSESSCSMKIFRSAIGLFSVFEIRPVTALTERCAKRSTSGPLRRVLGRLRSVTLPATAFVSQ